MTEKNKYNRIVLLIPAYNPDIKLIELIDNLIKSGFIHIIIVNDGSDQNHNKIFDALTAKTTCRLLTHEINIGKGGALKTGFKYIFDNYKNCIGVITADADGQHTPSDIIKIANRLMQVPDKLIIGSRDFSKLKIPFRSRFGNELTRKIFGFLTGIKVKDTQTGLRGIPFDFISKLIHVRGDRYEYEMNMLLESKQQNIIIDEVDIQTIYLDDNKSSHFNPLFDSIRIYSLFIKYVFSSFLSFLIDIGLFTLFIALLKNISPQYYILLSTIGSRVISSLFNYFVNKNAVFNKNSSGTSIIKYYTLCIAQLLISGLAVTIIRWILPVFEPLIKIVVDSLLSVISYKIQKEWVFKTNKKAHQS